MLVVGEVSRHYLRLPKVLFLYISDTVLDLSMVMLPKFYYIPLLQFYFRIFTVCCTACIIHSCMFCQILGTL